METVEVVVYLGISVILGLLVLQFMTSWDFSKTFEHLKNTMSGKNEVQFGTVDMDEFVGQSLNLWESCGLGEVNKSLALYVVNSSGTNNLNKSEFFKRVKMLNLCSTLQSVSQSCGTKENVFIKPVSITLPHIVRISCNISDEVLLVEGK